MRSTFKDDPPSSFDAFPWRRICSSIACLALMFDIIDHILMHALSPEQHLGIEFSGAIILYAALTFPHKT